MSQSQAKFESGDNATAGSAVASEAQSARQNLSSEFVVGAVAGVAAAVAAKAAQSGDNSSPAPSERPTTTLGNLIAEGINNAARAADGSSPGQRAQEAVKIGDKPRSMLNEIGDSIISDKKIMYDHKFKVTDKDRTEAKDSLASGLSELIPDADRTLLKQMQAALIDGKVDKLTEALKQLAGDDPAKMAKFLKALNGQLGNIELSQDGKGNVLVYEKGGNTAVSINPKTGETTLRAVERQADGSVLLKPGEIINRQVGDVMSAIGDEATRGVVGPRYQRWDGFDQRYNYKMQQRNSGGGGGGGGGGGDQSPAPAAPSAPSSGDSGLLNKMKKQIEKDQEDND